jgi:hypothetical protein
LDQFGLLGQMAERGRETCTSAMRKRMVDVRPLLVALVAIYHVHTQTLSVSHPSAPSSRLKVISCPGTSDFTVYFLIEVIMNV